MTSIPFDTLGASKRLREVGLQESVAEAIVDVVRRNGPEASSGATKADLLATEKALHQWIDDLRTLIFAGVAFNLTGILAVGGFLYAVLK